MTNMVILVFVQVTTFKRSRTSASGTVMPRVVRRAVARGEGATLRGDASLEMWNTERSAAGLSATAAHVATTLLNSNQPVRMVYIPATGSNRIAV